MPLVLCYFLCDSYYIYQQYTQLRTFHLLPVTKFILTLKNIFLVGKRYEKEKIFDDKKLYYSTPTDEELKRWV